MDKRLVVLAGPLKGGIFDLAESTLTIGRESTNQICLADLAVSRRHCVIERRDDDFLIRDLESYNGTYVNGVPVKERILAHSDRIIIGDSHFLVLLGEAGGTLQFNVVQLDEERAPSIETVRLRREDILYLQPDKMLDELPQHERLARDLNALLKISTAVSSIRTLESLASELFGLIFAVVPAKSGAILLVDESRDSETFQTEFGWDRQEGGDRPVRVSQTIVRRVMREGISILSNDAQTNANFTSTESIAALQIRSLLAVPIAVHDRRLGVLYLSTSDPLSIFDEDHLQLMTAIAGIAAVAIENVRHLEWLENENRRLVDEIFSHNMVGESPRLRDVQNLITRAARADSTVLIRGESGTGKELAAQALHRASARVNKPFVAINCAALAETLLDSELFGHEKGAFTGAVAQKKGKLEIADGGTVFLDELGEMSPMLQSKLLRVLQEREFERIGGTRTIKTDIRLVAATNRDLEAMMKQGTFRSDLYYRLNVVSFSMPPLRERREDIPLLTKHFVKIAAEKCKRSVRGLTREAQACLINYDWPGNVRQLENVIESAIVLGVSDWIRLEDLPEIILEATHNDNEATEDGQQTKYHEVIIETKKRLILEANEKAGGNLTEAARLLGLHANYLHRLIRHLNLRAELKK
jgi:transcriptional regulator with GAF, ATPase, and Fis domain